MNRWALTGSSALARRAANRCPGRACLADSSLQPQPTSTFSGVDTNSARDQRRQHRSNYTRALPYQTFFSDFLKATADPREACSCVDALLPHYSALIRVKMAELKQSFETPEPVVRRLASKGRRGKVELIRYGSDVAVRKTWRPSQRSCWAREVSARTALAALDTIPPILASGENWIIIPFYEDILRWKPYRIGLLPLHHAKEIFRSLRQIHDAGYYLLDFVPWNIVIDRKEGVKFVDLEFLYPYERGRESFEHCFNLTGVPDGFAGDKPFGPKDIYGEIWQASIGLRLKSLLYDPVMVQHVKRFVHRMSGTLRAFKAATMERGRRPPGTGRWLNRVASKAHGHRVA